MKCYIRLKNGSSIRNILFVVIGFVSFYLICTITLLLNDGNNTIYKSNIQSSAGKMGGITQNNTKSIHINKAKNWESKQSSGSSKNYFQHAYRIHELGRVVDTTKCKIPDFDVWDFDVLPFIKRNLQPIEKCKETNYDWSYVYNNKLFINKSQVELDGYSLYKGFCCYKIIQRVTLNEDEQKSESKIKNADNLIKYSSCIDITSNITELHHEFIMVECGWAKFIPVAATYRAYHSSAMVKGSQNSDKVESKINYWKSINEESRTAPNVLILGIDSTSRLNFRRNMFKTKKILQELEAVEMLGYTKVGENTFPNFIPITTGYSEDDLKKVCYFSTATPQDDCPYVWKRFDSANYITAQAEDAPILAIFNYLKTGFVHQPVDFTLRPLMHAAHDYGHPPLYVIRRDYLNCIGSQTNDEAIISYVESVLDLGYKNNTPVFSVSWSTENSHEDLNSIQLVDNTYANFLTRIKNKGYLDNTILIFMGDHGYRYGPFRETLLGYYEDKLPNMWIRLPPWIREEFPEWQNALEINSRRLTTPYTLYWTLNHILEIFSSIDTPEDSVDSKTGTPIRRKYVQNFFESVPESNTCSDIGIPPEYCACHLPKQILLNDSILYEAAKTSLVAKNKELFISSTNCSPLHVGLITSGIVLSKSKVLKRFVVAFTTEPGNFALEAEIDYFVLNNTFSSESPSLHRTNSINPDHIGCIQDSKTSKLELYCYCL